MSLLVAYQFVILLYFLALNGFQLIFIVRAFFAMKSYRDSVEADELNALFGTIHYKPISLICPVYNEAAGVVASVGSLLALRYPETQVIVVNDGSKDGTLDVLIKAFRLRTSQRVIRQQIPTQPVRNLYESLYVPNLVVVDKENGGKADALNCGLNLASYPIVCCMDGDSLLENDSLLRAVRPFLDQPNILACGGVVRPVNGCKITPMGIRGIFLPSSWLARFQVVEYLRSFLYGRLGSSSFGMMFIVSGAFGLFRREVLLKAGGFAVSQIGEDFELVVRIHHHHLQKERTPYTITMVPDPICWTEVPETFQALARQRNRWQRGLLEALWKHRAMLFNPRYGWVGMISMPYFLFFEALAPVIEASGYIAFCWFFWTGALDHVFAALFLLLAVFMGILNSTVAVMLEVNAGHRYQGLNALLALVFASILENVGFRQLTVYWRLQGTLDFIRGKRAWGRMERKGLGT